MLIMAPRTFAWTRPGVSVTDERRGGFSDTPNEAGVRRWAEQIITAYRFSRDENVLHEIWIDGNDTERQVAERMVRKFAQE